jgi:hypothetical protein
MSKKKSSNLTSVFVEGAAPAIDAVLTVLESVPVVGSAVATLKAWDDFRARMMTAKLQSFIDGLGSKSSEEIKAMQESFAKPEEAQQMGEALLLTLESYTALEKCTLLGRLFLAYLERRLGNQDFRRLALSLNVAFPDDLEDYLAERDINALGKHSCMPHLVGAGLSRAKAYGTIAGVDGSMPTLFEVTGLGKVFREVINSS